MAIKLLHKPDDLMRKPQLLLCIALSVILIQNLNAQQVDSSKYTFESLPDILFPTGFLHDQSAAKYVFEGSDFDLHRFNGTIGGALMAPKYFEALYQDVFLSQRILSNGKLVGSKPPHLIPLQNYLKRERNAMKNVDFPMYLNWFNMNELDKEALAKGYLAYMKDKFTLVPVKNFVDAGQQHFYTNSSPIDSARKAVKEFTTFFGGTNAAAQYVVGSTATFTFSLAQALVQSNHTLPQFFDIDLGDGQGFRSATLNQTLTGFYSTNATKAELLKKILRIRVRYGTEVFESKFSITIVFNAELPDYKFYTSELSLPSCFVGLEPSADAKVSVKYADKQLGLQKPVVIVEGFEGAMNEYGVINFEGLATGMIVDKSGDPVYKGMAKMSWLYDSLFRAGFDVIHVDFQESKLSIYENRNNLIKVLHWVSGQNPVDPTTLVGASMGGLISRLALLELERNNCCMNVSAFGTFDTPHDGAFIPIGVQVGAKRFGEMLWFLPSMQSWDKVINSPAARQMLIDHFDPTAENDRRLFVQLLNNEQPSLMRRFAISNGSDSNTKSPLKDPDDRLVSWGKQKIVTYKHHVGNSPDTLNFNKLGRQKSVITRGANIEAHQGNSLYLYEGQRIGFHGLLLHRVKWSSQYGYMKAKSIAKWGPKLGVSLQKVNNWVVHVQSVTNNVLTGLISRATRRGQTTPKRDYNTKYSEIAGSFSPTVSVFESLITTVYSPSHTFIPAFSALNVGKAYDNLSMRSRMDIIPFHSYVSPGLLQDQASTNQEHMYINEETIEFSMNTLNSIYSSVLNSGSLVGDFNIAKEHNEYSAYPSQAAGIHVTSNAHLGIGLYGPVGKPTNTVLSDYHQNIEVFVGNGCHQDSLKIDGVLEIGDHPSHVSTLRISPSSTLHITKNGHLIIGPNSTLIIEKGATLFIEPGAIIEWNDGAIELGGSLNLTNGTSFKPNGKGSFFIKEGAEIIQPQGGMIVFSESLLFIDEDVVVPSSTTLFSLDFCTITFLNKHTAHIKAPFVLLNSQLNYAGTKQWPGLVISGSQADIENTTFNGGSPSILLKSAVKWTLENSSFVQAKTGLLAKTKPTSFYANEFNQCLKGAHILDANFTAERNLFYACQKGLIVESQTGSLALTRNVFTANTIAGAFLKGVDSKLECNEWSYNSTGLSQENGVVGLGGNAGNVFMGNSIGVYGTDLNNVQLNIGHNSFNNNITYDIEATFEQAALIPHNGTHLYINANFNSFSSSQSNHLYKGRDRVYVLKNANTSPSPYLCPAKGPGKSTSQPTIDRSEQLALVVFPSPSNSASFYAVFQPVDIHSSLEVHNASGQLVYHELLKIGTHRKFVTIPSVGGVYMVTLTNGEFVQRSKWVLTM